MSLTWSADVGSVRSIEAVEDTAPLEDGVEAVHYVRRVERRCLNVLKSYNNRLSKSENTFTERHKDLVDRLDKLKAALKERDEKQKTRDEGQRSLVQAVEAYHRDLRLHKTSTHKEFRKLRGEFKHYDAKIKELEAEQKHTQIRFENEMRKMERQWHSRWEALLQDQRTFFQTNVRNGNVPPASQAQLPAPPMSSELEVLVEPSPRRGASTGRQVDTFANSRRLLQSEQTRAELISQDNLELQHRVDALSERLSAAIINWNNELESRNSDIEQVCANCESLTKDNLDELKTEGQRLLTELSERTKNGLLELDDQIENEIQRVETDLKGQIKQTDEDLRDMLLSTQRAADSACGVLSKRVEEMTGQLSKEERVRQGLCDAFDVRLEQTVNSLNAQADRASGERVDLRTLIAEVDKSLMNSSQGWQERLDVTVRKAKEVGEKSDFKVRSIDARLEKAEAIIKDLEVHAEELVKANSEEISSTILDLEQHMTTQYTRLYQRVKSYLLDVDLTQQTGDHILTGNKTNGYLADDRIGGGVAMSDVSESVADGRSYNLTACGTPRISKPPSPEKQAGSRAASWRRQFEEGVSDTD